jgi:hypothetical protein
MSEEEIEKIHEEFNQLLAEKFLEVIDKVGSSYEKKYNYDSTISIFNVLLSLSANCAIELGMSLEDFLEVSKDFWQNAKTVIGHDELLKSSSWLEPSTKNPKDLS